jgi:hypothetical protein
MAGSGNGRSCWAGAGARPGVMLNALLHAYDAHPPAFFHPDNVSAILLRVPGPPQPLDETVLPGA